MFSLISGLIFSHFLDRLRCECERLLSAVQETNTHCEICCRCCCRVHKAVKLHMTHMSVWRLACKLVKAESQTMSQNNLLLNSHHL